MLIWSLSDLIEVYDLNLALLYSKILSLHEVPEDLTPESSDSYLVIAAVLEATFILSWVIREFKSVKALLALYCLSKALFLSSVLNLDDEVTYTELGV